MPMMSPTKRYQSGKLDITDLRILDEAENEASSSVSVSQQSSSTQIKSSTKMNTNPIIYNKDAKNFAE